MVFVHILNQALQCGLGRLATASDSNGDALGTICHINIFKRLHPYKQTPPLVLLRVFFPLLPVLSPY